MITAEFCSSIFLAAIEDYHRLDQVDTACPVREEFSISDMLYRKCWIDTVQWHLEDMIRRPDLAPERFVELKRQIDSSNQRRTDLVEKIDDWFISAFQEIIPKENARMNTETPAWAIDRLSILLLKIFHMKEQTERSDASLEHIQLCRDKLNILLEQKTDLSFSLNALLNELQSGQAQMKVYRQMKMYNDPTTNPQLYNQ
ncbi:MAG: DUF4254 domain-containing protein [Saprospiraceae bacterium]|nr:DUF4254 domain-containing protein [Saprospiraceae bacterium]HMW40413.1 DUF4254 domain-containing protein [Saprospiraceae bacterium]HMX87985.1 DUF4254 domain-containing protein [Saprospiraceae bacterium]HMZ39965.1 DUF4254 domain-containing protein [Saprospiraceae bacterium]HNA65196.1 DUF4254 domain-containing protein [Saprospiraceae bacterium]